MNLLDPIRRQSRLFPDRPAVMDAGRMHSYQQMWKQCGRIALALQSQRVLRGQCVAIAGMSSYQRLLVIMALARIGASSTSVQPNMPQAVRDQLFAQTGAVAWITNTLPKDGASSVRVIDPAVFASVGADAKPPVMETGLENEVWRIAQSSGTTGTPKCIPFTHAQGAMLQRLSLDVYSAGPRERLLVLADMNIGLALGHAMQQLAAGGLVIFPRSLVPQDMCDAIAAGSPKRVLATTANAAALSQYIATRPPEDRPRCDSILSFMVGGSALAPMTRAEIEQLICPHVMVIYGSTEMGSTARMDHLTALEFPESAGRLMPWVEGEAVDDAGEPLPPGTAGKLRFRSRPMATHYLGDPQATAAAFRGGWYYPGDVGSIDANGTLALGGRADDVLNLQGVKIDPATCEAALNTHASVRQSAVTVFINRQDRPVLAALVVAANRDETLDESALIAHIESRTGPMQVRARVFAINAVPLTPAGKLDRSKLPGMASEAFEALRRPEEV